MIVLKNSAVIFVLRASTESWHKRRNFLGFSNCILHLSFKGVA